jgi:hypothetical protein
MRSFIDVILATELFFPFCGFAFVTWGILAASFFGRQYNALALARRPRDLSQNLGSGLVGIIRDGFGR